MENSEENHNTYYQLMLWLFSQWQIVFSAAILLVSIVLLKNSIAGFSDSPLKVGAYLVLFVASISVVGSQIVSKDKIDKYVATFGVFQSLALILVFCLLLADDGKAFLKRMIFKTQEITLELDVNESPEMEPFTENYELVLKWQGKNTPQTSVLSISKGKPDTLITVSTEVIGVYYGVKAKGYKSCDEKEDNANPAFIDKNGVIPIEGCLEK